MSDITEESKVTYKFLGKCGLKVSNICLGTMTFGENKRGMWGQTDETLAHQLMERYTQWGGNFLDTADIYSSGKSESIVGSWLQKKQREEFVIATKCRFQLDTDNPNKGGLSRRHILNSIEGSLERLKTHYVDLYQMHYWDAGTPLEETLRTLNDLVRCGKILYIGVSNMAGWQMQRLVDLSLSMGLDPIVSLQQQYSLVSRESEFEAFCVCKQNGIGVLPYSPLKAGLLTGKYSRDTRPTSGRLGWAAHNGMSGVVWPAWDTLVDDETVWKIIEKTEQLGRKYDKSMAQIAIRWLLQKDIVSSVIVGVTKMSQLEDNMAAANGWQISAEDMAELDEVSMPTIPYPYGTYKFNKERINPFYPQ